MTSPFFGGLEITRWLKTKMAPKPKQSLRSTPGTVISASFLYVADQPKDRKLKVALLMAPSLYFLKTTRKNYEEMRKLLTESLKNNSTVLVTTDSETKEILDARVQP